MKEGFRLCLIYTLQVILMGSVLLMFLDFVLCFLSCLFLFVSFAQFILPVSLIVYSWFTFWFSLMFIERSIHEQRCYEFGKQKSGTCDFCTEKGTQYILFLRFYEILSWSGHRGLKIHTCMLKKLFYYWFCLMYEKWFCGLY